MRRPSSSWSGDTAAFSLCIPPAPKLVRPCAHPLRCASVGLVLQDEIDSIGGARTEGGGGGGDSEVQRTMLELLNQLDGFEPAQNIKVLMATNRIDILDPALLRPGRIDRKIEFPNPNEAARLHIVKIHSRKMNLMRGINLKKIANAMKGASGAESKAVCTEAGMFALRERRVHVTQEGQSNTAAARIAMALPFFWPLSHSLTVCFYCSLCAIQISRWPLPK